MRTLSGVRGKGVERFRWRVFVVSRRGFRSFTAFAAEWCAPSHETRGEKMGGGENWRCRKLYGRRPSSPPFPQYAAHHSASDDRNWRNLLRSKRNYHKTVPGRPTACQLHIAHRHWGARHARYRTPLGVRGKRNKVFTPLQTRILGNVGTHRMCPSRHACLYTHGGNVVREKGGRRKI